MNKAKNALYTTVTASDFNDTCYIDQLIKLDIGMELAFLTNLPATLNLEHYKNDLIALKQEVATFKRFFTQFNIPLEKIRIHQPGGYMYYWDDNNTISGYTILKVFFAHCHDCGFSNYVIHAPYGSMRNKPEAELIQYREKLCSLLSDGFLEVEEILTSDNNLKNSQDFRFYNNNLFEQLMANQRSTMLLDTYESGGIEQSIKILNERRLKGFVVKSVHLQKDKHKALSVMEFEKFLQHFEGNLINEGFISDDSSFDDFVTLP